MADLYAADNRGIYIPQFFAQTVGRQYVENVQPEDWKTLEEGPDAEWYWDAWSNVLDRAVIKSPDGKQGFLWQDGDLWIVWGDEDPDWEALSAECR